MPIPNVLAAAEQALRKLRGVIRTILPPVLISSGLPGALASLATTCPVPCHIDADVPGRSAASAEATVYFVADVTDGGRGGASE
ncbi:MAG: sensor histidine kinase, partial [Actinophytocola sp.]